MSRGIITRIEPRRPYTMFLISPANLGGERAAYVIGDRVDGGGDFALARAVRTDAGAPLGDVFSFMSGLYFRGKRAYAEAFGRAPPGLAGGLVISPGEGLRFLHERVTLARLRAWAEVDVDEANARFVQPLAAHAEALAAAHGDDTRFVLLGSVASDKYVAPLTAAFGARLLFPSDFVGRGDMSRGAMLLGAVRAAAELPYAPVLGSARHGPRAPGVSSRARRVRRAG